MPDNHPAIVGPLYTRVTAKLNIFVILNWRPTCALTPLEGHKTSFCCQDFKIHCLDKIQTSERKLKICCFIG